MKVHSHPEIASITIELTTAEAKRVGIAMTVFQHAEKEENPNWSFEEQQILDESVLLRTKLENAVREADTYLKDRMLQGE